MHENFQRPFGGAAFEKTFGHREQGFLVVRLQVKGFFKVRQGIAKTMAHMKTESHIALGEHIFRIGENGLLEEGDGLFVVFLLIADVPQIIVHLEMVRFQLARYEKSLDRFLEAVRLDRGNTKTERAFKFVQLWVRGREVDQNFVRRVSFLPVLFLKMNTADGREPFRVARILGKASGRLAYDGCAILSPFFLWPLHILFPSEKGE